MKRSLRTLAAILISAVVTTAFPAAVFAGEWRLDNVGWWYLNDDGSWPSDGWQLIGGKYYYFNSSGYMLADTTTPDGYRVGADGAWIQNPQTTKTGPKSVQGTFILYTDDGRLEQRYILGDTLGGSHMRSDGTEILIPEFKVTWNGDGTGVAESDYTNRSLEITIISRNSISIDGEIFNRVVFNR